MDALPFQPTVGTCIISESAMTGLAAVDSVGGGGFRTMRSASAAAVPISSYTPSPRFSEQTNLHDSAIFNHQSIFDWPGNCPSHPYANTSSKARMISCESYQLPLYSERQSTFPLPMDVSKDPICKSVEPSNVLGFEDHTGSTATSDNTNNNMSPNVLFNLSTSPVSTTSYQSADENTHLIVRSSEYTDQVVYSSGTTLNCRKQKRSNAFVINTKPEDSDELNSLLSDHQIQSSSDRISRINTGESGKSCTLTSVGEALHAQFCLASIKGSHFVSESKAPVDNLLSFHCLRPSCSLMNLSTPHPDRQYSS
ncbi:unnamed protein product [Heterobilharzia americana]|nr:unnamed protein product [Heterobilharzia americana]